MMTPCLKNEDVSAVFERFTVSKTMTSLISICRDEELRRSGTGGVPNLTALHPGTGGEARLRFLPRKSFDPSKTRQTNDDRRT